MDNFFYLYTLIIMFICACSFAFCFAGFLASRKRSFVFAMGIFTFYFLDLALIFQYEYTDLQKLLSLDLFYTIDRPILRIFIGLGMLQSLWLLVLNYLGYTQKILQYAPGCIFIGLCISILNGMQPGPLQQFCFYTVRQLFIILCLAMCFYAYIKEKRPAEKILLARHKTLFRVLVAVTLVILVEDVVMILIIDPALVAHVSLLPLYISERNFSENLLILICAFSAIKSSMETLQLRFKEPPSLSSKRTTDHDLRLLSHIDEILPHFCEIYRLTSKEREVLYLMVLGLDNQNIASELCLALGTIKKHAHNIFIKVKVKNRVELLQRFWQT